MSLTVRANTATARARGQREPRERLCRFTCRSPIVVGHAEGGRLPVRQEVALVGGDLRQDRGGGGVWGWAGGWSAACRRAGHPEGRWDPAQVEGNEIFRA